MTPTWLTLLSTFVVANLLHSLAAVVWATGAKQALGHISSNLKANILTVILVFPPLAATARILGIPGPPLNWTLLRIDAWTRLIIDARPMISGTVVGLLAGTTLIFLFQEFLPFFRWQKQQQSFRRLPDERLSAALDRVNAAYARSGVAPRQGRPLRIFRVDMILPLAALQGLVEPKFIISSGLLSKLSEDELEAVIAHEVAHLYYGGNFATVVIWFFRALQACNPVSLVLFRDLIETRERACDEMAAWVTCKPSQLASAILKVDEGEPGLAATGSGESDVGHGTTEGSAKTSSGTADSQESAVEKIHRRAESYSTRMRVTALQTGVLKKPGALIGSLAGAAVVAAMMWGIQ